jgi:signal transduction histidine kinase
MSEQEITSQEMYVVMEQIWLEFQENHARFNEKKVKSAAARSRKSINELRKLIGKYRSTQLAETKQPAN